MAGWQVQATQRGADLYNADMPVAAIIEYGVPKESVKPGQSMIEALKEWVLRKGLAPRTETLASGKARGLNADQQDAAALQIARAIAWKMKRYTGIFNRDDIPGGGLRILERTLNKYAVPYIRAEIIREIRRRG